MPADMLILLEECNRILRNDGKLLIKLNPYIESENNILCCEEFKKIGKLVKTPDDIADNMLFGSLNITALDGNFPLNS